MSFVRKTTHSWSVADSEAAAKEGWDVFFIDSDDARPEIEKVDETDAFADDSEACAFVAAKAAAGSELHRRALLLDASWDHYPGYVEWIGPHLATAGLTIEDARS